MALAALKRSEKVQSTNTPPYRGSGHFGHLGRYPNKSRNVFWTFWTLASPLVNHPVPEVYRIIKSVFGLDPVSRVQRILQNPRLDLLQRLDRPVTSRFAPRSPGGSGHTYRVHHILQLGHPQSTLRSFLPYRVGLPAMYPVRRADPCPTLSRLLSRLGAATVKPTFLTFTGFERRLPALLTGVFAQRRTSKAGNAASSGYEVLSGVFHSASVLSAILSCDGRGKELASYSVRQTRITHWFRAERSAPSARLRELEAMMYIGALKMTDAPRWRRRKPKAA